MRYLEQELQYMNENLVLENFNRCPGVSADPRSVLNFFQQSVLLSSLLTPLWNNSVKILYQTANQHSQQEGQMVFCQRLQYTLQAGLHMDHQAPAENDSSMLVQFLTPEV